MRRPLTRARSEAAPFARLALAVAAGWLLIGCSTSARAAELMIGAAVSLREPVEALALHLETTRPGTEIRLAFGASSALAAQIRAGAPLDVLLSADARVVDDLGRAGHVAPGGRFAFVRNRLVVLVRPELASIVRTPDDLLVDEVRRIALAGDAVPVGHYAREWLDRRGILEALQPRIVLAEHARAVLAAVDHGHADVAVVYASDATFARGATIAFEIPDAEQPQIVYVVARLMRAVTNADATAFLAALCSADAAARFAAAGFVPLDPAAAGACR